MELDQKLAKDEAEIASGSWRIMPRNISSVVNMVTHVTSQKVE